MLKGRRSSEQFFAQNLVADSPLRRADPRTKLVISAAVSLAVMLPLERLALFAAGYLLLMAWARLLPAVARQVWRVRWVLLVIFGLDWWLFGIDLAATVSLRIAILTGVFTLFFSTTTPSEFARALEALRLPYRYAFSVSLAVSSLGLLEEEWRAIREAQAVRGVSLKSKGLRETFEKTRQLIALTVPAIVLTTRRAWNATEAAYARGFDSPQRQPYQTLRLAPVDFSLLLVCLLGLAGLFGWK